MIACPSIMTVSWMLVVFISLLFRTSATPLAFLDVGSREYISLRLLLNRSLNCCASSSVRCVSWTASSPIFLLHISCGTLSEICLFLSIFFSLQTLSSHKHSSPHTCSHLCYAPTACSFPFILFHFTIHTKSKPLRTPAKLIQALIEDRRHNSHAHSSWSQPRGKESFLLSPGLKSCQSLTDLLTVLECNLLVSLRAALSNDLTFSLSLPSLASSAFTVDKKVSRL